MRRRRFLREAGGSTAITAGVASVTTGGLATLTGCLGGRDEDGDDRATFLVLSEFTASWELVDGDPPSPVRFAATPADDEVRGEDPGRIRFTLANLTREDVTVDPTVSPPFGVLYAVSADRPAPDADSTTATPEGPRGFLLWRPYEEEGCADVAPDGTSVGACDSGEALVLSGGESVQRSYEVRQGTAGLSPGRFVVSGRVRVTDSVGAPSTVGYAVRFAVRRRSE